MMIVYRDLILLSFFASLPDSIEGMYPYQIQNERYLTLISTVHMFCFVAHSPSSSGISCLYRVRLTGMMNIYAVLLRVWYFVNGCVLAWLQAL